MNLSEKLKSLIIFRSLREDETVKLLDALLSAEESGENVTEHYAAFAASLFSRGCDLGALFLKLVQTDENLYTAYRCGQGGNTAILEPLLDRELSILEELCAYDGAIARQKIGDPSLPSWVCGDVSLKDAYREQMDNLPKRGCGIFFDHAFFILDKNGDPVPTTPFGIRSLATMYTYESHRQKLIANTEALIKGEPAANVLLYGDAGTGKSSSIKAIVAHFQNEGLRLIEIKKEQIALIPRLTERLSTLPMTFILFLDDITLTDTDPACCVLKTVLEGGAGGLSPNTAVYVTSNHRRLIKETVADRTGEAVHVQDNLQGVLGLSARFGLTITFMRPDKQQYRDIVCALAKEKGLEFDEEALCIKAEAYAIRNNGRTPRAAGQFIDLVVSGVEKI